FAVQNLFQGAQDDQPPEMPVVEFIEIKPNGTVKKRVLRNRVRQQLGEHLDTKQLHEDISAMYGLDYFKMIRYHMEEKDHQQGLVLDVEQRQGGTSFFRLGMSVSDDFRGNGEYGDEKSVGEGVSKKREVARDI